jgi:hypothetical protein
MRAGAEDVAERGTLGRRLQGDRMAGQDAGQLDHVGLA